MRPNSGSPHPSGFDARLLWPGAIMARVQSGGRSERPFMSRPLRVTTTLSRPNRNHHPIESGGLKPALFSVVLSSPLKDHPIMGK